MFVFIIMNFIISLSGILFNGILDQQLSNLIVCSFYGWIVWNRIWCDCHNDYRIAIP